MIKIPSSLALSLCLTVCTVATAGPDWDEGGTDAGQLPNTSQVIVGSTPTGTTKIRGQTTGGLLLVADPVDMYLVKTGSNVFSFKVDMDMGTSPAWSARLCLFRKRTVLCQSVSVNLADPIATVTKVSAAVPYPVLDGSVYLANFPTTRLGDLLLPNTEYYVAVCGATSLPIGLRETCSTGTPLTIYQGAAAFGISAATSNEIPYRLSDWYVPTTSGAGDYSMPTTGVYPLAASTCSLPVHLVGSWARPAFDFGFAPAIASTINCAQWAVNREFFYVWTPNCTGDATVTTCGETLADTGLEVFDVCGCATDTCLAALSCPIACNDDTCNYQSKVTFAVQSGRSYLVRLTRVYSTTNPLGYVSFACAPSGGTADVNGDGIVDGGDLALLLGAWGTAGP